jgi:ComF family protein
MGGQYIETMPQDSHPPRSGTGPVAWLAARWPRPCLLCGGWDCQGLCAACRRRFVNAEPAHCPRCALPSIGARVCGACLRDPPPFSHCVALAGYGFPWDRLIARFKFQDQPELAGLLAALLSQAVDQAGSHADLPRVDAVLPVPLGPARLAERGYNQAWELARRVAARQGLPAEAGLLQRLHDSPHQVGLGRAQRARNLGDALWVAPDAAARIHGRSLALVDDVLTTGVTAMASTRALLAAGAASVQVWVLARTPPPDR